MCAMASVLLVTVLLCSLFSHIFAGCDDPHSGCREIAQQFTGPSQMYDGRYQAVIGDSITLSCEATKNSSKYSLNVCIRDVRPEFTQAGRCTFGTRRTCINHCLVNFTLENVQQIQASTYCCNGSTNVLHPGYGVCVQVDVGEKKSVAFRKNLPSTVSLTEGDDLILDCQGRGYPEPRYTWLHDDKTIMEGSTGRLNISSVTVHQNGHYQCIIKNRFTTRKSSKVLVDIAYIGILEKNKYYFIAGGSGLVLVIVIAGTIVYNLRHRCNRNDYDTIDNDVVPPSPTHKDAPSLDDVRVHNIEECYDEPYAGDQQVPSAGTSEPTRNDESPGNSSSNRPIITKLVVSGGLVVNAVGDNNIIHINNPTSAPDVSEDIVYVRGSKPSSAEGAILHSQEDLDENRIDNQKLDDDNEFGNREVGDCNDSRTTTCKTIVESCHNQVIGKSPQEGVSVNAEPSERMPTSWCHHCSTASPRSGEENACTCCHSGGGDNCLDAGSRLSDSASVTSGEDGSSIGDAGGRQENTGGQNMDLQKLGHYDVSPEEVEDQTALGSQSGSSSVNSGHFDEEILRN